MRIKKIYCDSVKFARESAPWLVRLIKIKGAFIAFETEEQFRLFVLSNKRKNRT